MTDESATSPWPRKLCELRNHTLDSTRWNDFPIRNDDVVIASWAKSGTTWLQQIVMQLRGNGAELPYALDHVIWVEQRHIPAQVTQFMAARARQRVLKTHLPVESLVFHPQAKYLYVGRDGRDVLWSWYNHHKSLTPAAYSLLNDARGLEGPPLDPPQEDIRAYFREWLAKDGYPLWPFWSHVNSWWQIRTLPNVKLIHFNQLKKDVRAAMREIAAFLDLSVDDATWPLILEHCSFEYMRSHASQLSSSFEVAFEGGGEAFMNRGTNGRWSAVLTPEDVQEYEKAARDHLPADCALWLATGEAK